MLALDLIVERNVMRTLLESGLKKWDEEKTIAQYIFDELEQFSFESPVYISLFNEYKLMYDKGLEPTAKTFLYHKDENVRNLVISITVFPYELSQKWDEVLEGMNIVNRDNSQQDALMSVNYYKLKKIKKMFEENQQGMEHASFEDQLTQIKIHQHLKEAERAITTLLGTVIIK